MSDAAQENAPSGVKDWMRGLAFAIYMVLAVPLADASSQETPGARLAGKVFLALIVLLVVGSVNWGIARARKQPRPWWRCTFSFGPYAIALVLILLSSVGQAKS